MISLPKRILHLTCNFTLVTNKIHNFILFVTKQRDCYATLIIYLIGRISLTSTTSLLLYCNCNCNCNLGQLVPFSYCAFKDRHYIFSSAEPQSASFRLTRIIVVNFPHELCSRIPSGVPDRTSSLAARRILYGSRNMFACPKFENDQQYLSI